MEDYTSTLRSTGSGGKKRKVMKSNISELNRACLLSGEGCTPEDPKQPERWIKLGQCRTVDRGETFKLVLEDIM